MLRAMPGFALIVAMLPAPAPAQETITAHGISAFGDLKYPPDFAHFDYVNPDAPKGGEMVFRGTGASQTFDSLNAFILKGEPAQGLGLLYDSLLTGSADEPDSEYGLVAESLEYPPDRSWVIFTLRQGARFADGVPITPADIVWSLDTLKEKGHPQYRILYQDILSAEALDERRVRFTFAPEANKRDLISAAGGISIIPKHFYVGKDFAESSMEFPLGSSGYQVVEANPGRSVKYCRIDDYWAEDLPVNVGTGNFDCYTYQYFADNTTAFEAFKVGEFVFHEEFFSKIWATEYNFPAIEKGWVIREEIPDNRPAGTQGWWINLRREKFQDPRVREALGLMFNFEFSNETLFYGIYRRTDSFWENTQAMQADGLPQGEELAVLEKYRDRLPATIFTEPAFTPVVNNPQRIDRAVTRRASQLLDEAGWTLQDGLRRNAAGEVLTVSLVDDNPSFERVSLPYVENLRAIGIDARLEQIDPAQMQERQETFDYDLTPSRLVMSLSPSIELRSLFGTEGANAQGTLNLAGVADPVVDGLIEDIINATDRPMMEARVRALDRVLRSMHIWVPQWNGGTYKVAYWDIFGRPPAPPTYARGDAYWWIDQGKLDALRASGAPL
jgi:microcin C transport system substrate-binding protein